MSEFWFKHRKLIQRSCLFKKRAPCPTTVNTINKTCLLSKNSARVSEALRKLSYKQIWHLPLSSGRGRLLLLQNQAREGWGSLKGRSPREPSHNTKPVKNRRSYRRTLGGFFQSYIRISEPVACIHTQAVVAKTRGKFCDRKQLFSRMAR